MHIRPILSALSRHRASALLIALEIALACAVLCNACFLIIQRLDSMRIDSGVDEASLAVVRLDGYADQPANDLTARVLAGLRRTEERRGGKECGSTGWTRGGAVHK